MLNALFLVLALIVLLIIHDRVKYRKIYKLFGELPGPITIPLIGIAYDLRSIDVIIGSFSKLWQFHGTIFAAWIFRVPTVTLSDPKHLKIVLNSENCLDKEKRYELAKRALGNALFLAPAKLWKKNRKLLNPTMHQKILDSFFHVFVKHSELMLERMENKIPENKLFDIDEFLTPYFLDIQLETLMGINEELPPPPGFLASIHRLDQIVVERSFKPWLHPEFLFRLSPLRHESDALITLFRGYIKKVIEKRSKQFYNQEKDTLSFNDNRRKPFLEHLLSDGNDYTIEELVDEVGGFLIAAMDRVATTLGYIFVCLGALQDVQEKVVEELLNVFGNSDRPICIEDLPKLQYLERVIKEAMRLFSSVPFVARSVVADTDIGDYVIPEGVSIIVPIFMVHRNEKLWPDPLKFDPDRFLPSEVAKRHPYSYIPFSGGIRNCIGKQYAMMCMKVTTSYILRNFKIDTNVKLKNIRSKVQVVAKIVGGANVSIKRRHKV